MFHRPQVCVASTACVHSEYSLNHPEQVCCVLVKRGVLWSCLAEKAKSGCVEFMYDVFSVQALQSDKTFASASVHACRTLCSDCHTTSELQEARQRI